VAVLAITCATGKPPPSSSYIANSSTQTTQICFFEEKQLLAQNALVESSTRSPKEYKVTEQAISATQKEQSQVFTSFHAPCKDPGLYETDR
jgi:hypothetical protein